ncbi:MAG TPA: aminotransferase class I/II-fold pyridoxal phosphate-dependent enzyme [Vicinamibacterales bacterium]|jgi:dTDP-4-amino-4,6-dideoxygalactose transaminase|nr:aminotransferase class I/II-fold pyridoxal phosphate-dependent enzyme [Vicinamibacterales bacterium]
MSEHIPFIDLRPWVEKVRGPDTSWDGAPERAFDYAAGRLLDTCEFLGGGPTTQKLEAALSTKLGVSNVITCANGTDALQLALRACGIEHGHRVAIPNLTFWATYEAVVNVGATPVLIDIDPDDRQMSFDEFKRAHDGRRFDAAILVHLYGWCSARLAEFRKLCRERHITLIEDGAQAFGVEVDGQSVFADADVATLSFHPAKVLGGIGDGGAVLCKTARVAQRVRALANHGRAGAQHEHVAAGWNSRLDAIQSAWLLRALDVIDEVIEARRSLFSIYEQALPRGSFGRVPGVQTNGYMLAYERAAFSQLHADEVAQKLVRDHGVEARRIYPMTISQQAHGAIEYGSLLESRRIVEFIISLPLYYGMSGGVATRVAKAYAEAMKEVMG